MTACSMENGGTVGFDLGVSPVLEFELGAVKLVKGEKGDKGDPGKSAYEYAVEAGYTGTEEEFMALLAALREYAESAAASAESAARSEGAASSSALTAGESADAANAARLAAEAAALLASAAETAASGYAQSSSGNAASASGSAANAAQSAAQAAENAQIAGSLELLVGDISDRQTALRADVDGIHSSVTDMEGRQSSIEETLDGIRFHVSDPTVGPEGSYVTMTLTVGDNTYRGVVMIDGNVDVSGSISASALYAAYGSVANLEVNRLSTSRRIIRYLAEDGSDDQYIKIEGRRLHFIQAKRIDGTEQAVDPNGASLYWEQDISEAVVGQDGYPYVNGQRVFTTTSETDWPVMTYRYSELVKLALEFDPEGRHEPRFIYGAGWGEDDPDVGKGFVQKDADAFSMWLKCRNGKKNGIFIGPEHTHITGLPKTSLLDFSGFDDGSFTEELSDGETAAYGVAFDAAGRPSVITDGAGHETEIVWGTE